MPYRRIFLLLLSSLLAGGAGAVELGEPRISSFRGQALVADIELSSLDDAAGAVQVRVANPDIYRGASVTVPPVLSALTLSVVRQGGKQFVHVTSNKPVDTEMLLLFLELGQGGQRDVRLATLFLAADPRPAPAPVPVAPVAAPVAVVAPAMVPAPAVVPVAAPAVASIPAPTPAPPAPLHIAPVSTALPVSLRHAPGATCKASAANTACAILDKKNVVLQAKLAGLEDKIKLLQATLAPVQGAIAATTTVAATIVKPAAPVAVIVTPKKPKPVVHPPSTTPWLWVGVAAVAALAVIGAVVFLLLRRRRGKAVPVATAGPKPPGFISAVKARLMRRKAARATPDGPKPQGFMGGVRDRLMPRKTAPAVEPVLET